MAATQNELITASTYNAIRSKVNKVLGSGNGAEFGYGQTLQSRNLLDNDLITALDMQYLYNDIVLAAKHQTGNPPVWDFSDGLNAPDTGEIVGVYAAELGPPIEDKDPPRSTINAVTDTDEGYLDFEQASDQIVEDHFQVGPGALSTAIAETSVRTTAWNSSISHAFTVTWDSFEHRRTWANAGGQLRIDANLTGGTSQPGDETQTPPGTKDEIWQTMLNTMGTIVMSVSGSSNSGTGVVNSNVSIIFANRPIEQTWEDGGYNTGAQALTLYTKNGSGVYSENEYVIRAYEVSDNAIRFEIVLSDFDIGDDQDAAGDGLGTPVDENVTGTITSTVTTITPNGFLSITAPVVTQDSPL